MTLYSIRGWNDFFENNRTRELKKLDWVPIPNKMDGDSYTELMSTRDGASLYGVWIMAVLVASKCVPRGFLIRENGFPHTADSLARVSRMNRGIISRALEILKNVRWLDAVPYELGQLKIPQAGAGLVRDAAGDPPDRNRTEGKRREEKGTERNRMEVGANDSPPSPEVTDEDWLLKLQTQECYATVSVRDEFRKMHNWCEVNRKQPTRRRFVNWLNRCERPLAKLGQKPDDRQRQEVIHVRKL